MPTYSESDFEYRKNHPARKMVLVVPAAADLTDGVSRGLHCGVAGTVDIRLDEDSADVTGVVVNAGVTYPWAVKRISAATATVYALY